MHTFEALPILSNLILEHDSNYTYNKCKCTSGISVGYSTMESRTKQRCTQEERQPTLLPYIVAGVEDIKFGNAYCT